MTNIYYFSGKWIFPPCNVDVFCFTSVEKNLFLECPLAMLTNFVLSLSVDFLLMWQGKSHLPLQK
jgi:hypothetical protein